MVIEEKRTKTGASAVEQALAEVKTLAEEELAQPECQRQAMQELDAAKRSGDWPKAAALTAEIEHLADAGEVRDRRRAAIIAYHLAQAEGLRQQAAVLRKEAEELAKETAPLLAKLRELEGVPFVRRVLRWDEQAPGVDYRSRGQRLTDEADDLEHKALDLERHPEPMDSGSAVGANVEELVTAVLAKAEIMGPTIPVIQEWAARQPARDRFNLSFRNGKIV